eukprot:1062870-Amphidinium_carterae.1
MAGMGCNNNKGSCEVVSSAEIFYNWAKLSRDVKRPWSALCRMGSGAGELIRVPFSRSLCHGELQACVNIREATIMLPTQWEHANESVKTQAGLCGQRFLLYCGDTYGDWRRVCTKEIAFTGARHVQHGAVLPVSDTTMRNLWHLLHVLIPAIADGLAHR